VALRVTHGGVDGLALFARQLEPGQPPAAPDAEQIRARRLALHAALQHGMDLVGMTVRATMPLDHSVR
jgi:uncharacterized protein YbjT (DUF2867 family)